MCKRRYGCVALLRSMRDFDIAPPAGSGQNLAHVAHEIRATQVAVDRALHRAMDVGQQIEPRQARHRELRRVLAACKVGEVVGDRVARALPHPRFGLGVRQAGQAGELGGGHGAIPSSPATRAATLRRPRLSAKGAASIPASTPGSAASSSAAIQPARCARSNSHQGFEARR